MKTAEIQGNFFRHIKQKLPAHLLLVDEVAELLNISPDSAYRRIRGEKPLTIDEIQILALHYSISLDSFMNIETENIEFLGRVIDKENYRLDSYLKAMVKQLEMIEEAQHKQLYFWNKDIPIFYHFLFPELACFKCYFWSRYNLNYTQFNRGQFLISDFIDVFNNLGSRIFELYVNIPSTEIWNVDCINTTIRQIDFYRETKVFQSKEDVITIYECLEKLIDHLEQQVEMGYKFPYKKPAQNTHARYNVFMNEFVLGDNTVAVEMDEKKLVFLNHSVINYIMTTNKKFVNYVFDTIHLLLKKSTLISDAGEKDRQLFFQSMRQRIFEKKKLV
jgi:hypothetical protein